MGVVYKLKQEIIDFIIGQKRLDDRLSCRKISGIVKEKFQVDVSKSAVNAVIKQANLSSPVGRKSKSANKSQKFKIPEERKAQLLTSLQENLLPVYKEESLKLPEAKKDFSLPVTPKPEEPEKEEVIPLSAPPKEPEQLSKQEPCVSSEVESEQEKAEGMVSSSEEKQSVPADEKVAQDQPVVTPEEGVIGSCEETPPEIKKELAETLSRETEEPVSLPVPPQEEIPEQQPRPPAPLADEKPQPSALPEESPQFAPSSDEDQEKAEEESIRETEPLLRLMPDPLNPPKPVFEESAPAKDSIKEEPLEKRQEEKEQGPLPAGQEPMAQFPAAEEPREETSPQSPAVEEPVAREISPDASFEDAAQKEGKQKTDFKSPGDEVTEKTTPVDETTISTPPQEQTITPPNAMKETQAPEPSQSFDPSRAYVDDKIWTPDSTIFLKKKAPLAAVSDEENILYDHAGCFFLKAAEWELSHSPILGGILGKYTSGYLPFDLGAASEVLQHLKVFGIKDLEEVKSYDQPGIWKVNNLQKKLTYEMLTKLKDSIQVSKSLALTMTQEYAQIFSETSYLKMTLADTVSVFVDGQLKTLWPENAVHSIFTVPLNKSLVYLSENFIGNTRPVFFSHVPGYKNFAKQFYEMMWAFEDMPGKNIVKMAIFDTQKNEIAHFNIIPKKKRYFAVGAWPWQEECKKFIDEDIRLIKHFFHDGLSKEIYYSEIKTALGQPVAGQSVSVRVALLRETGLDWPVMAVVTNIPAQDMSMEEVIAQYLTHWPNFQEGHNDFSAKAEKASYGAVSMIPSADKVPLLEGDGCYNLLDGTGDIWRHVDFLLSAINNYCQRHFFPPHYEQLNFPTVKQRFYDLPGHIVKKQDCLMVRLLLPGGYAYRKDLEYALRRLNESNIRDYSNIRLMMGIEA